MTKITKMAYQKLSKSFLRCHPEPVEGVAEVFIKVLVLDTIFVSFHYTKTTRTDKQ